LLGYREKIPETYPLAFEIKKASFLKNGAFFMYGLGNSTTSS
jgi:hypothetical protein